MCSAGDSAALPALGFPIRASAGQRLFSASPRLIAAVHALHRLLVPRHPPCALTILTVIEPNGSVIPVRDRLRRSRTFCGYCAVFKDRRRRTLAVGGARSRHARWTPGSRRSLKAQQHAGHPTPRSRMDATSGAGPARFGRRARPAGRSGGPEWVAGSSGAPLGAP